MDGEQAETEPAAQPAHAGVGGRERRSAAGGSPVGSRRHRKIDQVSDREPVDPLQHEAERERQLELDHDRRVHRATATGSDGDLIAAPHLALYLVAEILKEPLHRLVQVDLALERAR